MSNDMFIYHLGILTFHVMYNIKNKIQVSPWLSFVLDCSINYVCMYVFISGVNIIFLCFRV